MAEHGGNIYRFAEENKVLERLILDFSASINPLGLPATVISEIQKIDRLMYHYPDPEARQLKEAISTYHGISSESIICGNGSTELIYLCVRALKPQRALIPAPTFSEYERACRISGSNIEYYHLKNERNFHLDTDEFIQNMVNCDMAFICNPNNPTASLIERDELIHIVNAARDWRCYLVIDEAFIDFVPNNSIIQEVLNNPYLIVLRSMTKFYALSAFRLGFGIFHPSIVNNILKFKEPWTVNTPAQIAGIAALKDDEYRERTYKVIAEGKTLMEEGFKKLSIQFVPSLVNYYLLEVKNAQGIITSLKRANIMVRDCSNFKGLNSSYIRVAVKSNQDNEILLKELSKLCME